jgi:hypothetical protein
VSEPPAVALEASTAAVTVLTADEAKPSITATVGDASAIPPSKDPRTRAKEDLIVVLLNHNDFVSIR